MIGAGLFATAMSFWLEKSLSNIAILAGIMTVLVVPIIEEIAKFLSFRAIGKRDTLIVVLVFLIGELVFMAIEKTRGSFDTAGLMVQVVFGATILRHIMFWVPEKLTNFSIVSLPVAILFHVVWNIYSTTPEGEDGILAAGLALATIPFLFLIYQQGKSKSG